ncbi:ribulokinase [Alkalispirochaeta sphaeroplastigenens]|uniref:ribulokinase n=1 Tax=Alkalispirochaeta sphaeroplastigenens TaxID=1187066 RepID=UPI0015E1B128|nr:ribulokinase [Alkalispirochaeta sphaeroplastigenens]
MGSEENFFLGIDFGTSAVRAVVLDAKTGKEVSQGDASFPLWEQGRFCDPLHQKFRQHPKEQIESMTQAVRQAVDSLGKRRGSIQALSIDTTGSTPCAVDSKGLPLALTPLFSDDPDAMSIMWKDHSAVREAQEITHYANFWEGDDFLRFSGGAYSSEWFWAKILYVLRNNPVVSSHAAGWLEHCDWISALLVGIADVRKIPRSACGAGHKALWNPAFSGYPPLDFFEAIDSGLTKIRRELPPETVAGGSVIGFLCDEWASRLGLPRAIPVGVGVFDAHAGALGAGIMEGALVKVMGTSSAEILVVSQDILRGESLAGIESQASNSIIPGMEGIEAGQSAFGDIIEWLVSLLQWDHQKSGSIENRENIINRLSNEAEKLPKSVNDIVATDWFNGRRAPFSNHNLRASIHGLTLGTKPEEIYRALLEAMAFGTRSIHDLFIEAGLPLERIIGVGGIPHKSPYLMQILSDVLEKPVFIVDVRNASVRGAAVLASVAGGYYSSVTEAVAQLGAPTVAVYEPQKDEFARYRALYERYQQLGRWSERQL